MFYLIIEYFFTFNKLKKDDKSSEDLQQVGIIYKVKLPEDDLSKISFKFIKIKC